jgi:two-component system cell cycle sensor histidine kinase/response regulator CckA
MAEVTLPDATAMVEYAAVGMLRATSSGRILYANLALLDLLGYPRDELLALHVSALYLDPADREVAARISRERGIVPGIQFRWRRRDGAPVEVRLYAAERDDPEHGRAFDVTVVDVTDLMRQREELERTATTLDLVVGQLPAVYWLVDRDQRILRTGGPIAKVLGYEPGTYLGVAMRDVDGVDATGPDIVGYHRRALAGEVVRFASQYRDKLFENVIGPHRVDGEIIGAIGAGIDVTAARLLERRMIDAQRAESLGVLAGGLAHDFNNLLVAILGNAELALRELPAATPGRDLVDNIRHAGRRAAELTDQLLAFAGRGSVVTSDVAARPVIDELLRITGPTMPPGVDVRVDVAADLVVRAAPTQLRQAILNLLTNARDALAARGRGGRIAVAARAIDHDGVTRPDDVLPTSNGRHVAIEVCDDGPGVSGDAQRRIFEPFFTTKPAGHGLGLAAVLGIVRSHGGGLRVDTPPGGGARFTMLWPAADAAGATAAATTRAAPATRTVLVIDDEVLVRDVVARMVDDLGYAALTAADGAAALAIVDTRPVDAVLVDLGMPGMSGAEVVAALRARRPKLPVVLCSGYDRDHRGPVVADAYLPKPFELEALANTLERLLAQIA